MKEAILLHHFEGLLDCGVKGQSASNIKNASIHKVNEGRVNIIIMITHDVTLSNTKKIAHERMAQKRQLRISAIKKIIRNLRTPIRCTHCLIEVPMITTPIIGSKAQTMSCKGSDIELGT
jgi:hypothetical protein